MEEKLSLLEGFVEARNSVLYGHPTQRNDQRCNTARLTDITEDIRAELQWLPATPTDLRAREVSPYERFLELPVPIVLVVCWLFGVALIGSCAGALYLLLWSLVRVAAGA